MWLLLSVMLSGVSHQFKRFLSLWKVTTAGDWAAVAWVCLHLDFLSPRKTYWVQMVKRMFFLNLKSILYGCFIISSESILALQGQLALPRGGKPCNPFSWRVGGNSGSLWRSDLVLSWRPMVLWGRADPTQWPEIASSVHFTLKWELIHVSSNVVPLLWSWCVPTALMSVWRSES